MSHATFGAILVGEVGGGVRSCCFAAANFPGTMRGGDLYVSVGAIEKGKEPMRRC